MLQAIRYTPADGHSAPTLQILDQLLLPHETTYISIQNCEEAHDAIKRMQVRGAPAIAIVAALALAVEAGAALSRQQAPQNAGEASDWIGKKLEYLKTSRPTAVNLGDAVGKLKTAAQKGSSQEGASGQAILESYVKAAQQMLVDDVSDNEAIGRHGAHWIQTRTTAGQEALGLQMMTICNTGSLATAGYGTALGIIRALHTARVLDRAYCLETRPYNQGSRLTAYELVHDHIPATLITDSMAASLMSREQSRLAAVVVGADRVAANGDTANKIGTYSLAVLARHHGIKFLVAAPRTTIDRNTASGADIIIEQRAPEELTRIRGPVVTSDGKIDVQRAETISTAALGIDVWNPAFDVTPASLIDGVVTELGVIEKVNGVFDFQPLFESATGS